MPETFSPFLAPTGRVLTFIEDPNRGTLPASCTIYKLRKPSYEALADLFHFVQKALITAAGVNVHLDGFDSTDWPKDVGSLYLDESSLQLSEGAYLQVQDSMEFDPNIKGDISIIDAAFAVLDLTLGGIDVYLDLSLLRPQGTLSSKGQIASGPDSFFEIFKAVHSLAKEQTITSFLGLLSTFNSVIRRGGIYKNGAVTTSLPVWSKHFQEYAQTDPKVDHPWLKKGAVLPKDWQDFPFEIYACIEGVNDQSLWLEKAISALDNETWLTYDEILQGIPRLGHNVCREVLLDSNATCILLPINLGQMKEPSDLVQGFVEGMGFLCQFQKADHQSRAKIYLPATEDRQVGLGLIALANLLALEGITYEAFVNEMSRQIGHLKAQGVNGKTKKLQDYLAMGYSIDPNPSGSNVSQWVTGFIQAYSEAARVADHHNMSRAFAIAPTANVSYRYKDREGNICAPEISPPLNQKVMRLSSTVEEDTIFDYGKVEIASEVGFMIYFNLANLFQTLMDLTGLGHAISFNIWEDLSYDNLKMWSESKLKSTYYRLDVDQSYLDKTNQVQSCGIKGEGCG